MIGRTLMLRGARCIQMGMILTCLANAQEHPQPPSIVVRQCSGCHGQNGDSELSYVPRLAGINASYLESKLNLYRHAPAQSRDEILTLVFRHHRADDTVVTPAAANQMVGIAKAASEKDLKAAAEWYAAQRPPVSAPESQLDAKGKAVFTEGIPAKNVPACRSCHGSDGQGTEVAPRIAGQHDKYILDQLALFRDNGRPSSPMTHVAQSLPQSDAEAIAKYLDAL